MFDHKKIEEISAKFSAQFSEIMANSPVKDIEKNTRAAMNSFFSRFDMVTREEFDIQTQVLERANEKISLLEARLAQLEKAPGATKRAGSATRNTRGSTAGSSAKATTSKRSSSSSSVSNKRTTSASSRKKTTGTSKTEK